MPSIVIDNVVVSSVCDSREFADRLAHSLGGFATDDPNAEIGLIHNDGRYYVAPSDEREDYFDLT